MTDNEIFNSLFNGGRFALPYLIKFSHPDLDNIYLVNNNEDIIFNGDTYKAASFEYYPPNLDGDGGSLNIISAPGDNSLFEFIENGDHNYRLDVTGVIIKAGEVQQIKAYKHFYGSVNIGIDNNINFTLEGDDRLNMNFTPYTYDTDNNRGNA